MKDNFWTGYMVGALGAILGAILIPDSWAHTFFAFIGGISK